MPNNKAETQEKSSKSAQFLGRYCRKGIHARCFPENITKSIAPKGASYKERTTKQQRGTRHRSPRRSLALFAGRAFMPNNKAETQEKSSKSAQFLGRYCRKGIHARCFPENIA